ncbi:putative hydrolase YxeP [bioreactor metagenome]|uniref:Putative hydrolase YxeP n=1 Tax=bioreactor metagenome TaxID=1076179 RepID=A0A644ZUQ3_9ZZZZ
MTKVRELAEKYHDYVVTMRREFHENPEPSLKEVRTCKRICEELEKMGIPYKVVAGTGVVGTIKGAKPGKTVALRGDIDALTVKETNDIPYKSKVEGIMHACGHDAHAAGLLGAGKILNELKGELCGEVRLLFQPAEETADGAKAMIKDGCLEGVDSALGIHVWSGLPLGKVSIEAGPRMAAAGIFQFKVTGKGGHGAMPNGGVDAGVAAASILLNLQSIVSRELSPMLPTTVTVGKIVAGTRWNVLASEAVLDGTVRTFSRETQDNPKGIMERIIKDTAPAYRCTADWLDYRMITTPCINPEHAHKVAAGALTKCFGEESIGDFEMQMGGEDFCYMMEAVPDSLLAFVGVANPEKLADKPHHAGNFMIDEDGLVYSVCLYAQYAMDYTAGA